MNLLRFLSENCISKLFSLFCSVPVHSQANERSRTDWSVLFPSERRERKVSIPRPLGRRGTLCVPGPGLAPGFDTFHCIDI